MMILVATDYFVTVKCENRIADFTTVQVICLIIHAFIHSLVLFLAHNGALSKPTALTGVFHYTTMAK